MDARMLRLLLLLGVLHTAACTLLAPTQEHIDQTEKPALRLLSSQDLPAFLDDFDHSSLLTAAKRHLAYLQRQDPNGRVLFGNSWFRVQRLIVSVERLVDKLQEDPSREQLHHFLVENYFVYQVAGRTGRSFGEMLVTGYYEPTFAGSLERTSVYSVPLYAPPPDLVPLDPRDVGKGMARIDAHGKQVPFWERSAIDNDPTLLRGNELVYLADPFEAFLLHVQGSGRIRLPDQTTRTIRFAATNGHGYKSIGKLLVDEGKLALEEATIPGIRGYLQRHPEEARRVLHHNPRYVFFEWGDKSGPRGSYGEILTPGRSVALDKSVLPPGPFAFVATHLPPTGKEPLASPRPPVNRIVFPQDTGAAIKGSGRIDIFLGNGQRAEDVAHRWKEPGQLYFFLWKDVDAPP